MGIQLESTQASIESTADVLGFAHFRPPTTIELAFADGRTFSLSIESLDMPAGQIEWTTLTASSDGGAVLVNDLSGAAVSIDAATLRYLVDPAYAQLIDARIATLHVPRVELEKSAEQSKPPKEWYDQTAGVQSQPSWK